MIFLIIVVVLLIIIALILSAIANTLIGPPTRYERSPLESIQYRKDLMEQIKAINKNVEDIQFQTTPRG